MQTTPVNEEKEPRPPAPFDRVFWLSWILVSTLGWLIGWSLAPDEILIGFAIGVAQWLVLRGRVPRAAAWILATTAGWAAGDLINNLLLPEAGPVVQGAVWGLLLGLAQWVALRNWVHRSAWWVILSALGWAVGPILGPSVLGGVVGAITGYGLELLLRHARLEPAS